MMRALIGLMIVSGLAWGATEPDPLPRRGFFGAQLTTVEEGSGSSLPANRGVRVESVFPDSAAAALGLQSGDILLDVGGVRIEGANAAGQTVGLIRQHRAGDEVSVTLLRKSETLTQVARLVAMPEESDPAYDTMYRSVEVNDARHRVIFTKPKGDGPYPMVFFIQGLGCSSIEYPHDTEDPIRKLIAGLTVAGYATMRVEKSGMGDSQGPPCRDIDFDTELAGYEAACAFGFEQEFVDPSRVFLFGHSMGGVFAPIVAKKYPVAGVMVFGTIGVPLEQYFVENSERQFGLQDWSESLVASQMELVRDFNDAFFGERKTPGQVIEEEGARMRGFLSLRDVDATHFFGRHYEFWFGLDDQDMAKHWAAIDVPALVVWGTTDIAATRGDHVVIAEVVNRAHPGNAEFVELEHIDHGFGTALTMKDAAASFGTSKFNEVVVETCTAWLARRFGTGGA